MKVRAWLGLLCSLALPGCDCAGSVDQDAGAVDDADVVRRDASTGRDSGPRDAGIDSAVGPICDGIFCNPGQRCEAATCVDNACSDLTCSPTERCEPHPLGGNTCVSIACSGDVQCDPSEYCNGTICEEDTCTPGVQRCDGEMVVRCASNGGGEENSGACGSPSYYETMCASPAAGVAGCSCEDDWDCPSYTTCDAGTCVGTGRAPSCTLPPIPFAEVLPQVEIEWGGESRSNPSARDGTPARNPAPWPDFGQVMMTPVVANLDDDNGDGLINELDFPEVIFTSHQGNNPWGNGVLRAIHGGGPNKGADFFARCGNTLWTRTAPSAAACAADAPDADSGSPVAVGDLDGDGVPEIVMPVEDNRFRILSNTGTSIYRLADNARWVDTTNGETIAIANLDYTGMAEIIVGRTVYVLGRDSAGALIVTNRLVGTGSAGRNEESQMACPADVRPDLPGMEVVAGATLYRLPDPIPACASPPCVNGTLTTVWNAPSLTGQAARISGNGFCAVADVWGMNRSVRPGPANPLDGVPEVVLIDNGDLTILDARDGAIVFDENLGGGSRGGAPNVDDFDGDGFMEVASALQDFYVVVDLQDSTGAAGACPSWPTIIPRAAAGANPNPARTPGGACTMTSDCTAGAVCNTTLGQCVCLHNGWRRDSDDDSSRMTSSSVFDFNGDGAAEVLYNDECDFRVYDGVDGEVLFSAVSRSRTGIENPVIADVDNDGNAEVVSTSNTAEANRCDEDGANPRGPNGIRVWGDPTDSWVSARRIWNQQSYHVVNVTESGAIPAHAPESWGAFNGRVYNTYRSQPRSYGVAPDLTVVAVEVSSPDAACGTLSDTIDVTFEIRNDGDLRVGPGVRVQVLGTWAGAEEPLVDAGGMPLEVVLSASLEPGRSVFLMVTYNRTFGTRGTLPETVRVVVDPVAAGMPDGSERECRENNNVNGAMVDAGTARADLRVEVGTVTVDCNVLVARVPVTVVNDGTAAASDVLLRVYAGDPALGGTTLLDQTIAGPIAAGATVTLEVAVTEFPMDRSIRIFAIADPENTVDECNNANNADGAPNVIACSSGPI